MATDLYEVQSLRDAAAENGMTYDALYQAVRRGSLRAIKVGVTTHQVWVTTRSDVASYIASSTWSKRYPGRKADMPVG